MSGAAVALVGDTAHDDAPSYRELVSTRKELRALGRGLASALAEVRAAAPTLADGEDTSAQLRLELADARRQLRGALFALDSARATSIALERRVADALASLERRVEVLETKAAGRAASIRRT